MSGHKEIFRFVQMRNTPRNDGKGGGNDTRPDRPDIPDKPDIIDRVPPRVLDFKLGDLDNIINEFERGDREWALEIAQDYVDVVRNRPRLMEVLVRVGERAHQVDQIDIPRLQQNFRRTMRRFSLEPDGLEQLQDQAAKAFASLFLLNVRDQSVIDAGRNAIRGIAIGLELSKSNPSEQELRRLALASVVVNGFGDVSRPTPKPPTRDPQTLERRPRVTRQVTLPGAKREPTRARIVPFKGGLVKLQPQSSAATISLGAPGVPAGVGTPRKVSIGELMVTNEIAFSYEYGDIAHVENVMQTEARSRVHQVKTSESTTDFEETEIIETSVNELKTTEQFDMQEAMSSVSSKVTTTGANAAFSAGYGPVSVSTGASVSSTSVQLDSYSRASNYAKETIESATKELSKRVKTSRKSVSQIVVQERNRHSFTNTYGSGHVVGIYRYLNRVSTLETTNYGARLMLEFIVPEPAAYLIHAAANSQPPGTILEEPEPLLESPSQIDEESYRTLMHRYGLPELPPPPAEWIKIPASFAVEAVDKTDGTSTSDPVQGRDSGVISVAIPEGYRVEKIQKTVSFAVRRSEPASGSDEANQWIRTACDRSIATLRSHPNNEGERVEVATLNPTRLEGSIDIAWSSAQQYGLAVSYSIECRRTSRSYEEWQNSVWSEINNAYQAQLRAFQNQLAGLQVSQQTFEDSPLKNRETERAELKRLAVTMLTEQDFTIFASIDPSNPQTIDTAEAFVEGEYIRFFEDAFEWENMAHELYDYMWAGNHRWVELMGRVSNDLEHEKFLTAGAARLYLPVRPGHEIAILQFLDTGRIWDGETRLSLDLNHVLYGQIKDMLEEPRDLGVTTVGTEKVTLPTNLVMLQQSTDVNNPEAPGPIQTPPIVDLMLDGEEDPFE